MTGKISQGTEEECKKTDSATDDDGHLSGARYISHGQRRCGKHIVRVGGRDYELAGYANVLLRACDAHGTRVPSMRPGERQ